MADKIIKKVVLKDPVTGVYLHPETDITVPTKVSDLTNDAGYITASDVGNGTLTVQKNGTSVGTFTANTSTDKTINITVPTSAADVDALPSSTKYAASMDLSIDSNTYIVTAQLKDQDGANLGIAQTIDLPLESVVVSGSYDDTEKKIILTLESGSTIDVPVGDLIAGLQTEITSTNKLSADLIVDGTTNKVVTASEKSAWNGKQDAIADLDAIRSGASLGATALQSYTETDPIYLADKPKLALKSEIPDISGKLNISTYDIDRAVEKTTETTATNIVNVSITSDLIDDICSQLDAQTTEWSA